MSHAVFSIVTPVTRGREAAIERLLEGVKANPETNEIIVFSAFPGLHFASFTLFRPGPEYPDLPSLLVFEHNVDGTWRAHVQDLVEQAGNGLYRLYQHCEEPPSNSGEALHAFLRKHVKKPGVYHVGTPYRRADTVRADCALRAFLEARADQALAAGQQSPAQIWSGMRAAANPPEHGDDLSPNVGDAGVEWVSRREPRAWLRWKRWAWFVLLFGLACAIVAAGIVWLWATPVRLSAAFIVLFLAHGIATSVLIGWPVFSHERTAPDGETAAERRRVLRGFWRNTLNIWFWFAGVGWMVSLIPALLRLLGVTRVPFMPYSAAAVMGVLTVVILASLIFQWSLPTPELARPRPDAAMLRQITAQEDLGVTNHMSAMVMVRPGIVRSLLLRLTLLTLDQTWFHTMLPDVYKGRLFNFSTVHFAQWVPLGRGRYMFLSNYDHSFSRYLDDFGDISFGLARLWGMGAHSPGFASLERFKEFARTWMTPHLVWYSAYPDMAVTQVWNNEALRRGILADPATVNADEMLQRLVNAKDR